MEAFVRRLEEQPGSESIIDANDIVVQTVKLRRLNWRCRGPCVLCLLKDHGGPRGGAHHNNPGSDKNPRHLLP